MFDVDPDGAPPATVQQAARELLRDALAKRAGGTVLKDGWELTSHAAHPENEGDMAKLWNVWWEYTNQGAVFFGLPDTGAFVAVLMKEKS